MKLTSEKALEVEYPETDGRPMGETDLHRDWMFRLIDLLRYRYRGQRIYVSGDLMVYYVEGDPLKCVAPDAFVVKDCDPGRRRIFKVWEEGRAPDAVFEVTSRKSRRTDEKSKPETFRRLGVREYFLYDPSAEYLKPPLRGYRLEGGSYCPIEPDATGSLISDELDLVLRLEGLDLCLFDRVTGDRLLTEAEAERAAREAAEAETERLRKLLGQPDVGGD